MRPLICMLMLLSSLASSARADEAVTLNHDGATLHGTLSCPAGALDIVILHPGSGPTDRNGNQPGMNNDSLRLLGDALFEHGIAVLRYDKRGIGESPWNRPESDLRPSHYIDDLAAWARWAADEAGFARVHLIGHSEGALFAKAAAAEVPVASVIAIAAAGRPMGVLLREQTREQLAGAGDLAVQFERILAELEAGRTVQEVPPALFPLFRPDVQPYVLEWLAMDPAALAASLRERGVPMLVIGGSTDLQVSRADFDALAQYAIESRFIDGMNHVLKSAEGPIQQQLPSYTSPDFPLHDELVPTIVEFLDARPHDSPQ